MLPISNTEEFWQRKIPGRHTFVEPTAFDVAGSMFVASAERALSLLEELEAHAAAARTKKDIEDILAVQIERWREAVIQFRAERARRFSGGKKADV